MRSTSLLILLALSCPTIAEQPASELDQARITAEEIRKAAAADPTIKDASSPPVLAYLAEQKLRRLARVSSLRERIAQYQGDKTKEALVPVLKEQLAELEGKPLEQVNYDAAYGYQPTTGLVGYAKKVRLLQNTSDGKSMIQVENVALVMSGLETSKYPSGKFLGVDKAILIGAQEPDQVVNGVKRTVYAATLVDLETVLKAAKSAKKPNVLLIVVDDLNTDLGCYGHPLARSPNIDRLAARGVRFDRAYCQYALCAPSRWSFLSGLRPETTGIFEFQTLLRSKRPEVVFLPQLFRENEYFTAGMGKVFHDTRQSDRERSWDFYSDRMGDDAQEAAAVKERYRHKEGQRPFTPWTRLEGPEENTRDGGTSRRIAQFMEQQAQEGKPFFVAAGFHKPHLPWTAPTKYFDLYRRDQIPEPNDPPLKEIPAIALMTELAGNPPPPSRTEAMAAYYSCLSFMDAQVGVLLDTLDRRQLWDNTIVVFFSDHGYHLGDHSGLWAKFTLFEQGCRVPLLIAAPGYGQGTSSARTVELIDVYLTLAELCGLPAPTDLEGQSLTPLLRQGDADWNKAAYSMIHHDDVVGKSVRDERWRYTQWDRGNKGQELYDHNSDPGEYHNLAGDPNYAETVSQMKQLLSRN